ncbi:hypothetical protein [Robbsia andropogonis]|uniref:hypothetical protein n=1 Tax=Robbsia andropogonis TaxID=28092 RepID=UPI00209CF3C2|nr:hypothetical protein [Robbsia andropogonis]MCP1116600.1 hypothetical protein [Robbsia andropogonis]MCP1126721.1 hypothetical protein [Robbsia andropogonis]
MAWTSHPQARRDGALQHLLTLDELPRKHLEHLLRWAARYLDQLIAGDVTSAPDRCAGQPLLANARVAPMFFDAQERLLPFHVAALSPDVDQLTSPGNTAFRMASEDYVACVRAAAALGASYRTCAESGLTPKVAPTSSSGTCASANLANLDALPDRTHGEPLAGRAQRPLIDWLPELVDARYLIFHHPQNGAPFLVAAHCMPHQHVINAGDGSYAHPVRALCNVLDILRHTPALTELRVAIVGDIAESGIARSTLHALTTLGTPEIRVVGPTTLTVEAIAHLGATWYEDGAVGLADVDVVIVMSSPDGGLTDSTAPVVRFNGMPPTGDGRAEGVAPDILRQAVWMAVLAVLAGQSDGDASRVTGVYRGDGAVAQDEWTPPRIYHQGRQ